MHEQPEQIDPLLRFTGRLQVTVGILIILVAGSFTIFYIGFDIIWYLVGVVIAGGARSEGISLELALYMLVPTLFVAGLPLLVGIGLIHFGSKKLRRSTIKSRLLAWAVLAVCVALLVAASVAPSVAPQLSDYFERFSDYFESDASKVKAGKACETCDLRGANLSWANLSWANLSGADLTGADLTGADLSYADLSGANLSEANLSGVNLSKVNLSGAILIGANLSEANLSWANLEGVNLSKVNLSGAILSGAKLTKADLDGAIFCKTTMPWGEENSGCK